MRAVVGNDAGCLVRLRIWLWDHHRIFLGGPTGVYRHGRPPPRPRGPSDDSGNSDSTPGSTTPRGPTGASPGGTPGVEHGRESSGARGALPLRRDRRAGQRAAGPRRDGEGVDAPLPEGVVHPGHGPDADRPLDAARLGGGVPGDGAGRSAAAAPERRGDQSGDPGGGSGAPVGDAQGAAQGEPGKLDSGDAPLGEGPRGPAPRAEHHAPSWPPTARRRRRRARPSPTLAPSPTPTPTTSGPPMSCTAPACWSRAAATAARPT